MVPIESIVSQESIDKSTELLFASSVISGIGAGVFKLSSCDDIFNSTGIFLLVKGVQKVD